MVPLPSNLTESLCGLESWWHDSAYENKHHQNSHHAMYKSITPRNEYTAGPVHADSGGRSE